MPLTSRALEREPAAPAPPCDLGNETIANFGVANFVFGVLLLFNNVLYQKSYKNYISSGAGMLFGMFVKNYNISIKGGDCICVKFCFIVIS